MKVIKIKTTKIEMRIIITFFFIDCDKFIESYKPIIYFTKKIIKSIWRQKTAALAENHEVVPDQGDFSSLSTRLITSFPTTGQRNRDCDGSR